MEVTLWISFQYRLYKLIRKTLFKTMIDVWHRNFWYKCIKKCCIFEVVLCLFSCIFYLNAFIFSMLHIAKSFDNIKTMCRFVSNPGFSYLDSKRIWNQYHHSTFNSIYFYEVIRRHRRCWLSKSILSNYANGNTKTT